MSWTNTCKTWLAAAAFATATAACGDEDGDSASNDLSPDAAAPAEMPEPEPESEPSMPDPAPDPAPVDTNEPEPTPPPEGPEEDVEPGTIVEVATEAGTFDTLLAAAEAAGLVDALSAEGPLTVFAPTDEAFDALPEGTVDALLDDPDELADVLRYHVIAARLEAADIDDGAEVDTLLGPWLTATVDASGVSIGEARVIAADVPASNGVIHVIDRVLIPPAPIAALAASTPELSTLTAALNAAGLDETLDEAGPFTVFAPTDAAFEALPDGTLDALLADTDLLTRVLSYHVVDGQQRASDVVALDEVETLEGQSAAIAVDGDDVRIAGAGIIATDIPARNGVVHLIDAVLLPPDLELSPMEEPEENPPAGNIVEVAMAAGNLDTLVAAVEAAGMVEALSGDGPLTVFAPTDEAFAALPDGVLDSLLEDPEELAAVLSYHVVAGAVPSSAIEDGARVDSLLGPWLVMGVSDDGVTVGDASVAGADVMASNGVVHVIDRVLIPPATIADIAAANPELSTLVAALEAADLVETLSGPGPFTVFAPTNAAFEALPDGTLEALLDDTEALTNVLLYHVIGAREPASSVLEASEFEMLSGQSASVEIDGSDVFVAGARVATTDIVARNGVIHVLEDVMLPPDL